MLGDKIGQQDRQFQVVRPKRLPGRATDDESTKNEGKIDQAKASLKDAGEKVKDAFKN